MKYFFGLLAIAGIVYLVFGINRQGSDIFNKKNIEPVTNQTIAPSVEPTVSASPTLKESIEDELKKMFVNKYKWDVNKIELTVSKNENGYAKGSVRMTEEMGGGLWFAAKVNDKWELVFDGNGIITCVQLKNYAKFPTSIIPECFDETANKMVKR